MSSSVERGRSLGKLKGFVGILLTILLGGVLVAPSAYAHHPVIEVTVDCDGLVTFTSTAWDAPAGRGNPQIQISYAVDNGPFVALPTDPDYRYDEANDYQFTDSFTPDEAWSTLRVRATAFGTWDDGADAGSAATSGSVTLPTDCDEPAAPAASVADATCSDTGAVVHLTNTGGTPVDFTITAGELVEVVEVEAGGETDVDVTLPDGVTTTVTVAADGMETVSRDVTYTCTTTTVPVPTTVPAPTTVPVPTTVEGGSGGGDAGSGGGDAGSGGGNAGSGTGGTGSGTAGTGQDTGASAGDLPRTGTASLPLAFLALVIVLAGTVMAGATRTSSRLRSSR